MAKIIQTQAITGLPPIWPGMQPHAGMQAQITAMMASTGWPHGISGVASPDYKIKWQQAQLRNLLAEMSSEGLDLYHKKSAVLALDFENNLPALIEVAKNIQEDLIEEWLK